MTVRITVPHRPSWYQLMEEPLDSREVGERLQLTATRWWTRFRGAWTITVTATDIDTGLQRSATVHAFDLYAVVSVCPHCGGSLSSNQSGLSSNDDSSRMS